MNDLASSLLGLSDEEFQRLVALRAAQGSNLAARMVRAAEALPASDIAPEKALLDASAFLTLPASGRWDVVVDIADATRSAYVRSARFIPNLPPDTLTRFSHAIDLSLFTTPRHVLVTVAEDQVTDIKVSRANPGTGRKPKVK